MSKIQYRRPNTKSPLELILKTDFDSLGLLFFVFNLYSSLQFIFFSSICTIYIFFFNESSEKGIRDYIIISGDYLIGYTIILF